MKQFQLPASQEDRQKKKRALGRLEKVLGTAAVTFGIAAVACALGAFIAVIVAEFHRGSATLAYYVAGGLGGGAVLFALLALLFGLLSNAFNTSFYDFLERCDGEDSFFVGEGTLATFEEGRLRIHGDENEAEILVPFAEIRLFSVCARTRPHEKGKWSVVLEIPRRYLMKEGSYSPGDPPALVQTDAKERLFVTLEKYRLEAIGERMPSDMPHGKPFKPLKKYYLPDKKRRSRALLVGGLGLAIIAAGVLLGFFLSSITAGTVLGVFGGFLLARALIAFVQARSMFALYREGLYWREKERGESVFLKWEEIERLQKGEHKGFPILTAQCAYGDYHFPAIGDAWDYLKENFGEKCDA